MRVLKTLFIIIIVLVLAFVGVGLILPDQARTQREIHIDAKPASVFPVINGFHQFNRWSPWFELDPGAAYTYGGPPIGVGASSAWISQDPSVGAGSQEIVESEPHRRVRMRLVFGGVDSENYATLDLSPEGEGTHVIWSFDMDVKGSLIGRYFALLTDRMVGKDYEKGLLKLKTLVEGLPKTDFSDLNITVVEVRALPMASVHAEAGPEALPAAITAMYAQIEGFMQAQGLAEAEAPRIITHAEDESTATWQLDASIPLTAPCTAPEGAEVQCGTTYGGYAIRLEHLGTYEELPSAYAELQAFKAVAGLEDNGPSWEQNLNDAETTPPEELATAIYWPVK